MMMMLGEAQVRLEIGGVAVSVDDTAGLRGEGADEVEEEGMRRSAASFRKAQLRVIVLDGGALTSDTVRDLVRLLRRLAPEDRIEKDIMMGKKVKLSYHPFTPGTNTDAYHGRATAHSH